MGEKTSAPGVRNTLVTLTHLAPLVNFRLKPFLFRHLTRGERAAVLPGGNMKKTGVFVLLLATAALAQSGSEANAAAPEGTSH